MLTHPLAQADLASGFTSPHSSLQQPPLSNHCLSLTVTNYSLLTALRPCLSLSSSSLIGNLVCEPFAWVSCQNRQRNPLSGTHPHLQNKCPPSCHSKMLSLPDNLQMLLIRFSFITWIIASESALLGLLDVKVLTTQAKFLGYAIVINCTFPFTKQIFLVTSVLEIY